MLWWINLVSSNEVVMDCESFKLMEYFKVKFRVHGHFQLTFY